MKTQTTTKDWLLAAFIGLALAWAAAMFDEEAVMHKNKMQAISAAHQNNVVIDGATYNKHGGKQ